MLSSNGEAVEEREGERMEGEEGRREGASEMVEEKRGK
jgi:hypothetical protein